MDTIVKVTKQEIENTDLRSSEDLCALVEKIGYRDNYGQLQCNNGAFVSSLLNFFDDNPGAMVAVAEFIIEHASCYNLVEDEEECECDDGNE